MAYKFNVNFVTADPQQEKYVFTLPDRERTEHAQMQGADVTVETKIVSNRLSDKHHPTLYQILSTFPTKWKEIGIYLGMKYSELEEIEARPRLWHNAPKSWLSAMLAEWLQWAPGDERGSTNFATLGGLTDALNKAGLGELSQSLMTSVHREDIDHSAQ